LVQKFAKIEWFLEGPLFQLEKLGNYLLLMSSMRGSDIFLLSLLLIMRITLNPSRVSLKSFSKASTEVNS
jgi:hypothetical protein